MSRALVVVVVALFMLPTLILTASTTVVASENNVIVEPICNANRNTTWTVGLIYCDNGANEDYTLFSPMSSSSTYLIDTHGREIHSWNSPSGLRPGLSAYILDDGDLLRTENLGASGSSTFNGGGVAGKVERLSWDSQIEWEWNYDGETMRSHHDIEPMPNGNVLMIAWELKSETESEDAGRDPSKMTQNSLWPDHIIEIQPLGSNQANIVWEWHIWGHLIQDYDVTKDNYGVVANHPELLDINFADGSNQNTKYGSDWMHCNGIDYNPALDQIVLSCKNTNEFYVIDHSTTTLEAASHSGGDSGKGGDILYRWGNPEAYGAGTSQDQQLFGQHDIQWIQDGRTGAGDFIVFNNGAGRISSYSSVDTISPPLVNGEYALQSGSSWGPAAPYWTWDQGANMFGNSLGGVERLENGNTLVTSGVEGIFYEIDSSGDIVWKYINPVVNSGPLTQGDSIPQGQNPNSLQNVVFKANRYNSSFPGFAGKSMTPGDYIESWTDNCGNEESIPWDSDGDGCIDDSDGDGVKDNADICNGFDDNIDVDADGIPDGCDPLIDSDGDGIADDWDIDESQLDYTIVDTGQYECYGELTIITCPTVGDFVGQDAQHDGVQPSYLDNEDGTITDLVTGLMWQENPNGFVKAKWDDAIADASTINTGGFSDWRVPTIKELYSLIDFRGEDPSSYQGSDTSTLTPFIDTNYFGFEYGDESQNERIIDSQYWSSTEYVSTTMNSDDTVFGVNFADGRIKGYPKVKGNGEIKLMFIQYVRDVETYGVNDFVDNGDGTITDRNTGLMWQRDDSGSGMNWNDALIHAEQLNFAGHDDWRLPNVKELQSILDYSRSPQTTNSPAIDPVFNSTQIIDEGNNVNWAFYWSSTTHATHQDGNDGRTASYVAFGEALGWMQQPPNSGTYVLLDVHGAGAQRSDPKDGDPADYPNGHGPQGDVIRINNFVRAVRNVPLPVQGCMNSTATNFDANATVDDGSCEYPPPPVEGCMNSTATNFDANATVDDGSCEYPPPPVDGCMNSTATNFDANATVDNGSCEYPPPPVEGCMNSTATNFDVNATVDNGSCEYPPPPPPPVLVLGCMNSTATNFDANATDDDGSCSYSEPPLESVIGCTYPSAMNYNPDATVDSGDCTFSDDGGDSSSVDDKGLGTVVSGSIIMISAFIIIGLFCVVIIGLLLKSNKND
jgi:hypothetical protein